MLLKTSVSQMFVQRKPLYCIIFPCFLSTLYHNANKRILLFIFSYGTICIAAIFCIIKKHDLNVVHTFLGKVSDLLKDSSSALQKWIYFSEAAGS